MGLDHGTWSVLAHLYPQADDGGEDWAYRFDEAAASVMTERPEEVAVLQDHPDYALAVPTPDHFWPLLYVAGIAAASGGGASCFVRGCTLGSVSMTCYGVGLKSLECAEGDGAAGIPNNVPPDQINL